MHTASLQSVSPHPDTKKNQNTKGETKQNAKTTEQWRENAKLAANVGDSWRTSKQNANQHQLSASGTAGAPMGSGSRNCRKASACAAGCQRRGQLAHQQA